MDASAPQVDGNVTLATGLDARPAVRRLMLRAKAAQGGERWDQLKSLRIEGELRTSALRGSFEAVDDALTGRHRDRYEMGVLRGENGFDGQQAWTIDPAGDAHIMRDAVSRGAAFNEAWRRSYSFWSARRAGRMRDLGERRDGSGHYRAVQATPEEGRPFEIWVNQDSGLFDRIVEPLGDEVLTTYLSEYRSVQGLQLPFKMRVSNGDPKYDQLYIIEFVDIDFAIDATTFAVPPAAQ
jgi:hypothetical protein